MPFPLFARRFAAAFLFFAGMLSVLFSFAPSAEARCSWTRVVYVNSSVGTDYGTGTCWGTSASTAYKSIQAALDARNAHYSSSDIIIYFRGNVDQSIVNPSTSSNDLTIRSSSASSKALLTIKGYGDVLVKGMDFTDSGGLKIHDQKGSVTVEDTTFTGASSRLEVSDSQDIYIMDNTFDSAYVFLRDSTGLVTLDANQFEGDASKTVGGENWHLVAQNLTGGFDVSNNEINSASGNGFYLSDVDELELTENAVDGSGVLSTGFYLRRVESPLIKGNDILDLAYAFKLYESSIASMQYNAMDAYTVDLYAEGSDFDDILINVFAGDESNIHFVGTDFDEIKQNAIWSPHYGMIFEEKEGDFDLLRSGELFIHSSEELMSGGSILDNDFYDSDLAIGMVDYRVEAISSNQFRDVEDGVYAYFSEINRFDENHLNRLSSLPSTDEAVYLYETELNNFISNSLEDFDTALFLLENSRIGTRFSRNLFSDNATAIYLENSDLDAPVVNNVFAFGEHALHSFGADMNGFSFSNNTLYGQSDRPLYLLGTFLSPVTLVNNVFSGFDPLKPPYVASFSSIGSLDYNLYNHSLGAPVFENNAGTYILSWLQDLGMEQHAYEESTLSLVDPSGGDFRLEPSSLAVNSADSAYAPPMDMNGTLRPVCFVADRGAFERGGSVSEANLDEDGDGLCGFQETAWGTDSSQADTDSDALSDHEEIYEYGTSPTNADTDGDGFDDADELIEGTDPLDAASFPDLTDTDGDGLSDGREEALGTSPTNPDTDGDGLSDYEEVVTHRSDPLVADMDGDGLNDYQELIVYGTDVENTDTDGDGLSDYEEVVTYRSDPLVADMDGDGLNDYQELIVYGTDVENTDSDGDGLTDYEEVFDYGTDPNEEDSDADGLTDEEEITVYGTDPLDADTDSDGFSDFAESSAGTDPLDASDYPDDLDGDGMDDLWENSYSCMDATVSDASTDDDADGVSALVEYGLGTNPCNADTDGDGLDDLWEGVTYSCTDPLTADASADADLDELIHSDEYTEGTDPCNPDSDGDLFTDGYEDSERTNPLSSSSAPRLDIDVTAYQLIYGRGSSSWTTSGSTSYTSLRRLRLSFGASYWMGSYSPDYGAFGLSYEGFLGTVLLEDCGSSPTTYDPIAASATCTTIPLYSSSSAPDSQTTAIESSSQLEAWSTLSSYYTFEDFDWYRPSYTGTDNYSAYKITVTY